ncbi:hypothetical protein [Paenibacillus hamazuiensis]|uniref:hypothetical protein n=1 Tax=Paenibacillus hamazuiensis TaxID=2936508 RepID=UPI00200C3B1A|nr:hypothetical protein [Paenibacillus hamazuiensis]
MKPHTKSETRRLGIVVIEAARPASFGPLRSRRSFYLQYKKYVEPVQKVEARAQERSVLLLKKR